MESVVDAITAITLAGPGPTWRFAFVIVVMTGCWVMIQRFADPPRDVAH